MSVKIIITGATGFLGSHLTPYLEKSGCEVTALNSRNCNLLEKHSLEAFNSTKYDYIFHLAAWTQAGDFCLTHSGEQWIKNQLINTHTLQWWAKFQPQAKLVFMGTSCAYDPGLPLIESNYMAGEPIESLYAYAMSKRMLYAGAKALEKQYGLRWLMAIPSTLYGAEYHTDGRQLHFIFDIMRKIHRGAKFGETPVLWGDGYQRRELTLVDDFVKILWQLAQYAENETFNIGAGEDYSIREFAGMLCKLTGFSPDNIAYDHAGYVGARSKCLDISKIKNCPCINYTLTPLNSGLEKMYRWFLDNEHHF